MKVAIVSESFLPVFNGVANSVVKVLETLKANGHEAIVVAPTTSGDEYLGFKTYSVPSIQLFQFSLGVPNPVVTKLLDEFQPDLLHVASPVLLGSQALAWAERNLVPSVAIFQTDIAAYADRYGFKFLRPVVDKLMASFHMSATLNLAPTEEVKQYLTKLQVPNVELWGRGVELSLYNPNLRLNKKVSELRNELAPNGEKIIGYVGRLAAEKQVDRFAELRNIQGTVIVLVGDGPERGKLESMFAGTNVKFVGKKSGQELADHYACFDIFVHFGAEETFGQTIQEAQASGCAVIAPKSGGPKFLIESGVSGYLIENEDKKGFRNTVGSLLEDNLLRARVAEGGRRSVLDKSWEANNSKLLEYYMRAISLANESRAKELLVA